MHKHFLGEQLVQSSHRNVLGEVWGSKLWEGCFNRTSTDGWQIIYVCEVGVYQWKWLGINLLLCFSYLILDHGTCLLWFYYQLIPNSFSARNQSWHRSVLQKFLSFVSASPSAVVVDALFCLKATEALFSHFMNSLVLLSWVYDALLCCLVAFWLKLIFQMLLDTGSTQNLC